MPDLTIVLTQDEAATVAATLFMMAHMTDEPQGRLANLAKRITDEARSAGVFASDPTQFPLSGEK